VAAPAPQPPPPIDDLLNRPPSERLREHKYRFAQSLVFGLPVIALQIWGKTLGGEESARWIGLFQAMLAGWVIYVGAAGELFEGIVLLNRRRLVPGLFVATAALGLYLASLASWAHLLAYGRAWPITPQFHLSVAMVAVWTGWQWWRLSRL
jgi:cation transport ATPase